MRRYDAPYRVRLTREVSDQVGELASALGRSEAEVLRKLVELGLTAPLPVLAAAGLTPRRTVPR